MMLAEISSLLPNVSRETMDRLRGFVALVEKWTPKINLISKASIPMIWERHILDSVQVFSIAPKSPNHWVDLGSGGGFPGIVAAILSSGESQKTHFSLIESDQRKSAFLRTAVRELSLPATVLTERIQSISGLSADVVSARALASLVDLLGYAHPHLTPNGVAVFSKGRGVESELAEARKAWTFDLVESQSVTDPEARLLSVTRISRA